LRLRRLAHEHRETGVAAGLVEKSIDETRLLLRRELAFPELVEVAPFEDAARREPAAGQRVADAESEEIVLKSRRLADVARAVLRRQSLQMKVHVRIAGARFRRHREGAKALRGGERVLEVFVDLFEVGDDRAAERGDSVEDEEIRVTAGREVMIEEDVDALGV